MQTIVSEGQSRVRKGGSTNHYAGLPWSKTWLKSECFICERSLTVLLNGWKFVNQSLITPPWRESLFIKVEILS